MAAGTFTAGVIGTAGGLSIDALYEQAGVTRAQTPGNVAVCLSGGGSRALCAGMGQLRALKHLAANGRSLLGQVKALSTVSGGSWLGVPFTFLPAAAATDDAYLGAFVEEQGSLTPAALATLPAGNAGVPVASGLFSLELLALEAILLYELIGVPPDMLWQTLTALHILAAHGLASPVASPAPNDTFTLDARTRNASVTDPATDPPLNPALANEIIDLFAAGPGRIPRPYLICNISMLLDDAGLLPIVPVQSNALFTGVVGLPDATDPNGQAVGGGGVASFAFNSVLAGLAGTSATVAQARQWSLTDAMGTSSAAFAATLEDLFAAWAADPAQFQAALVRHLDGLHRAIRLHFPPETHAAARALVRRHATAPAAEASTPLKLSLPALQDLIPRYQYWPIRGAAPVAESLPTRFGDGSSIDNTGITGALAYSDIDSLVSFINSEEPLSAAEAGVPDGRGGFIPGTNLVVDGSIPPLFGYQPYSSDGGYVLYPMGSTDPLARNQVFVPSDFPALLQGIAAAAGAGYVADAAIFTQSLAVRPNAWFGISGSRIVTVVWCYLNYTAAWRSVFDENAQVAALIAQAVEERGFPHYDTLDTDLPSTEVNLLSSLTAWTIVDKADEFTRLFALPRVEACHGGAAGAKTGVWGDAVMGLHRS